MADSSLDDFFAKKDKSKKKTKTKVASAGGDVDDGSTKAVAKKEKKKKDKDKQNSGGGSQNVLRNAKEDEEWKDFEEEKEVDYSGLRIQNMQIAKEEQDKEAADAEEEGEDEDGENKERRSGASGPWNKSNETGNVSTPAPAAPAAPEPVKEEAPTPKVPGKYVPPGARLAASSASSSSPSFPSRRKKEAPNLHSEEDFPTLGGGPTPGRPYNPYSSSGSSDVIDHPAHRKGVNLTLENKFSALQD
ncbi:protein CDV3 homolog isoform X2 [Aplysia californica]|uniref:Protein CDV3 homolog isoform X2 n=1 Tax=Aplysia californica TaxID=6500 RepID=A0ABM1A0G3_APLCA|nr:protein CDV3 homolog isoform X2 [Aplysia californica]